MAKPKANRWAGPVEFIDGSHRPFVTEFERGEKGHKAVPLFAFHALLRLQQTPDPFDPEQGEAPYSTGRSHVRIALTLAERPGYRGPIGTSPLKQGSLVWLSFADFMELLTDPHASARMCLDGDAIAFEGWWTFAKRGDSVFCVPTSEPGKG